MDNKGWFKDFMKLLNRNVNILKNDKEYETAKNILKLNDNSEYVINESMFDYSNDKRKDSKEENKLIGETRNIGKNMLKVVKNYSNYERLYNNLSNNSKFKNFFEHNEIEKEDMEYFANHIAGFKTKSIEQHEKHNAKQKQQREEMEQENETLKEENQTLTAENKKKDGKIARRDRRLESKKQQIKDLTEQLDKNEEELNQLKEKHEQETQRIKNFYEKKTDEMTKQNEAEIAKLIKQKNNIIQNYKTKYKETKTSMDEKQFEKEKEKITKKLNADMKKEIKEYEDKIEHQKIIFEAWKKANEEAQRLSLQEIDNKLKEREEEIINLNKQIEDERKQAEEDKRKIQAEANRDKNEKVAQAIHKTEERTEKRILEEYQQNQKEAYGFTPTLERYIKKKLAAQAYSLDEDELIEKIARDIGKPGGLPKGTDPKQVAKEIYNRGAEETIKHIKKIANLAILTGYNHDLYNKLPGDVAQEVQRYITDKINDDIRRKNIKYILPKDKPRWEHAMETKKLNPMLGRSAWRVN